MTENGEGFERFASPQASFELAEYLCTHGDIDPTTILLLPHPPSLLGGVKSRKFIVQAPEATLDTPPNPDAVVDLSKTKIPAQELPHFSHLFEAAEQ